MVVIGTAVPILLASDDDTEELESLMDSSKFWLVGMYNTLNPFAGASLGFLIHRCQTPIIRVKADHKSHFWDKFRHLF